MEVVARVINDNRTIVLLVLAAGSLFWYQKQVFVSEQEQKQSLHHWLKDHGLKEYTDNLDKAGVKTKESFARVDILKFLNKYYPDLNDNEHSRYHHQLEIHILKLQNQLSIYYWLERNSLEQYLDVLVDLGYHNIDDIRENLNIEMVEKITKYEYSRNHLSRFQYALKKLRTAERNEQGSSVGTSLVYYPLYLGFQVLWFVWWIVKTVVKTTGYLLFSLFLILRVRSFVNKTRSECQRRKVTLLNYATGNYLHPSRTRIYWQWSEPAIVGQAMTFVVEFYRYNLLSYPVDETSGISIETLLRGNMVANSCEYGGSSDSNLESNQVKVTFTVRQAGDYTLAVLLAGDHISGSPFIKCFLPGSVEPSKCSVVDRLSMVVIRKATYSPLFVQVNDKFGNTCTLTDENDLKKFKVDITKIGSTQSIDPELFVDTSEFPVANVLHIKLEEEGCYSGMITYNGCPIDNSTLTILSLTMDEWLHVEKNIEKHCYNVWYESSLLASSQTDNQTDGRSGNRTTNTSQNGISLTVSSLDDSTYRISNKKVYCYISPKHLSIKEYYMKIFPRKLHVFRVSPRTKLTLHPPNPSFEYPTFSICDGIQPPVSVMCKNRNVLVATFSRLVLQNIGGSETFKKKQEFFYQKLLSKHGSKFGCTKLKIDRQNFLESSFNACKSLYSSDWLRLFNITFQGEEGLDWGGLRREWFDLLSSLLFGHENQLFTRFKDDDPQAVVHPNPRRPNNLKLKYYEFAGRIVGKCLYESAVGAGRRQNVKAKFSRSFLAQLLGQRVTYKHFETDDKDLFRSKITYLEENDPEDLDLKFEEECFSEGQLVKTVELKPGGSNIPVTQENKLEYLDLLAQYRLVTSCQQEVESFMKGLNELVPDSLLSIFDENELELVMCGTGHISVADMKANYTNLFNGNHKVLDWFWTIVSSLTQDELARFVQFVTGSSQLPPGGFAELSPTLQISRVSNTDTLPLAHTCFNQLCLPNYSTFEQMQRMLLIAITEGCEGFGFA